MADQTKEEAAAPKGKTRDDNPPGPKGSQSYGTGGKKRDDNPPGPKGSQSYPTKGK